MSRVPLFVFWGAFSSPAFSWLATDPDAWKVPIVLRHNTFGAKCDILKVMRPYFEWECRQSLDVDIFSHQSGLTKR